MDADSSEEVEDLLTSLPYWGLVKVDVRPLISTGSMVVWARATGQRLQEQVR
jgi:muconolactone delta-isomerase